MDTLTSLVSLSQIIYLRIMDLCPQNMDFISVFINVFQDTWHLLLALLVLHKLPVRTEVLLWLTNCKPAVFWRSKVRAVSWLTCLLLLLLFSPPSMNCPPTKRLRGLNHEVAAAAAAFDDPFGDDEDFTQDDLDELDVMASQAFSSTSAGAEFGSKAENKPVESAWPSCTGQSRPLSRATTKPSRENTFGFGSSSRGNAGIPSREPLGEFTATLHVAVEMESVPPWMGKEFYSSINVVVTQIGPENELSIWLSQ